MQQPSSSFFRRRTTRRCASFLFAFLALSSLCLLPTTHASMGIEEARMYDRNLQHFSPEGRLYQVQYAERAARRGSPVVALTNGKDALVLCVERRRASALEDFVVSLEKIGELQAGAFLGFAGLAADGRRLLDRTRLFAENYLLKNAEQPGVLELAQFVADSQHRNTFVRAHRPYGVSCVLVGMCNQGSGGGGGPTIYATEPSGILQEYSAVCVGEHAETITARLEAHAAELASMKVGQLARFAARVLLDARGNDVVQQPDKEGKGDKEDITAAAATAAPGVELELLLLTRKDDDKKSGVLRAKRVFVSSRKEAEALGKLQGIFTSDEEDDEL